jgi:hypothetical protein
MLRRRTHDRRDSGVPLMIRFAAIIATAAMFIGAILLMGVGP